MANWLAGEVEPEASSQMDACLRRGLGLGLGLGLEVVAGGTGCSCDADAEAAVAHGFSTVGIDMGAVVGVATCVVVDTRGRYDSGWRMRISPGFGGTARRGCGRLGVWGACEDSRLSV